MAKPEHSRSRPRRWLRRALWAVLLIVFLPITLLLVTTTLVGPNALRPLLARVSEQYTGLPTEIGSLHWSLGLRPVIVAEGVRIGDAQFSGEVLRATATLDLTGLLGGVVVIDRILVEDAYFQLPESPRELINRIDGIVEAVNRAEQRPPGQQRPPAAPRTGERKDPVVIRLIEANDVTARMGTRDAFSGSVALRDVASAVLHVEADWALPYFAPDATLTAAVAVGTEGPTSLEGTLKAEGLDLNALDTTGNAPHARLDFEAAASGNFAEGVVITLTGAVDEDEDHALDGPIQGEAILTADAFDVTAFTWDSDGLKCDGAGRFGFDGSLAFRVPGLALGHEALAVVAALFPVEGYTATAAEDAAVDVQELAVDLPVRAAPRFDKGIVQWSGISVMTAEGEAFLPDLRGRAEVVDGVVQIEQLATRHLEIAGRIAPESAAGATRVDLTGTATLNKEALAPFVDLDTIDSMRGTVTVQEFQGTFGTDEGVRSDLRFQLSIADVALATLASDSTPALEATLHAGDIHMADGVLTIENVRGDGLEVEGTVTPDFNADRYPIDLKGSLDLDSPLLAVFLPRDATRDLKGTLHITQLSATLDPAQGMPTDLTLEGTLEDAEGTLLFGEDGETLRNGKGSFSTEPGQVHFDLSAEGDSMGPVKLAGNYDVAESRATAKATVSLARAAGPHLPEGVTRDSVQAILSAYGDAELAVDVELPNVSRTGTHILIEKSTEPALSASIALDTATEGYALGAIHFESTVPFDGLSDSEASPLQVKGPAVIKFNHDPGRKRFEGSVDLNAVDISFAQYLGKSTSQTLSVQAEGSSGSEGWAVSGLSVHLLDQTLEFTVNDAGSLSTQDARIDLTSWSPLLREGRTASGTITGHLAVSPLAFALQLDDVGFELGPEAALTGLTGGLGHDGEAFTVKDLHLSGTDTACTINATYDGQHLDASVQGSALNLNLMDALRKAAEPRNASEPVPAKTEASEDVDAESPETQSSPPKPEPADFHVALDGNAAFAIDRVRYERGYVDQFQANVNFNTDGVRVEDLTFRSEEGGISGSVALLNATADAAARAGVKLRLEQADVAVLRDFLPGEPTAFHGKYSGEIDVTFPMGNAVVVCNGLDGTINLEAEDGGFGKFGFATRLLSVLRATEVFRLRLPPTQDEGVVFDAFTIRTEADSGVLDVKQCVLTSKVYNLSAEGTVNFPKDEMRLHVATNPLELVTGVTSNVPLLGQGVDRLLEGRGVQVRVTGSPWNPQMSIETTPKIIRDVGGIFRGTVRGVGGLFGNSRERENEDK